MFNAFCMFIMTINPIFMNMQMDLRD